MSVDAEQSIVPAEQSFTPALPAWADEPGIDNPPFEENTGADSMSSVIFSDCLSSGGAVMVSQLVSLED